MKESDFEAQLGRIVRAKRGLYFKMDRISWPDRIILFPDKPPIFMELKKNSQTYNASVKQQRQNNRLINMGYKAFIIDFSDDGLNKARRIIHEHRQG